MSGSPGRSNGSAHTDHFWAAGPHPVDSPSVRLFVCGVRGSTPSPGPDFVRYGGNTPCIAIGHDRQAPTLALDARTGLQRLTPLLHGRPFPGSILLRPLPSDPTPRLPFFASGD